MDFEIIPVKRPRIGNEYTYRERELAHNAVIEVIKKVGGIPVNGKGEVVLDMFVEPIRKVLLANNEVPEKYKDRGRPAQAYMHLAKMSIGHLKALAIQG